MKSFYSVALTLVVFLAIVQLTLGESSFAGTWYDNRGYTISLCITNGDKLQGSYQEFGILQGDISQDGTTVQGRWYEARNPLSPCPYGGFTFKLQNSNHWEGNFDCADETNADNYVWNGDRYSPDIVPSSVDCGILASRGNIRGAYVVDPSISTYWDICTERSSTEYYSSYECDTNLDCFGYEEGFIYENGRVFLGGFTNVYPDGNSVDGSSMVLLLNDSSVVHYQWASPITTARVVSYSQHVAQFDIVYSDKTTNQDCSRNLEFYDDLYLRFSSSSLPQGYTEITVDETTQEYDDQTTRSTVDNRVETSASSHLTLCFILATIILLLV